MGKNKAGGGGGGGGGGSGGPTLTLEQFADSLVGGGRVAASNPAAASVVDVSRWEGNPRVHLLRFKSAAAQRDAMVSERAATPGVH